MKKTYIPNIDRNIYIDNYFSSSMIPFQSTLEQQSSLKIIELNDSNTTDSDENYDQQHTWCYVDKRLEKESESKYKVNAQARAKRRMNRVSPEIVNKTIDYLTYDNKDFVETENSNLSNALYNALTTERIPNNPLNCFTIINNELADSDQTTSDNEDSMKIIQCGDVVLEDHKRSIYSNETNYNRNIDSKRTIWIYSFKNRNLLTEESENVSTEDSTSSSSFENNDYKERISTPIPSFIPRLNFYVAATLPPVTEVIEPLHIATPNNIDKTETLVSKLQVTPQFSEQNSPALNTAVPSQNIINWMALSPRERRRKIKTNLTDVIVNDCEINIASNKHTESNLPLNIDKDLTYVIPKRNEVDNEITIDSNHDDNTIDEKGDHRQIIQLKKPQILLKTISPNITDPIEKLNGDEWIGSKDENKEENLDIDEKKIEEIQKPVNIIRCAGDRLLNKNMTLLKPVEWAQYLPITDSIPSLHLSLPSDINDEKKSWFKYIIKYFQCCKICK
ncbi:PREDICTED: uncharacterized protein LOC106119485 [Papilio xuthus]|uniref:Uncharacterized protein LOC106119485 n=1 Tax=Papilio xuthus TaxID=66420 RepID=A0AAJ7EB07_PAPXU|nr:PREDICTED: uncharacterized protein LOC106119485 [Papilio xuthus]